MSFHWDVPAKLPDRLEVERLLQEARVYRAQELRAFATSAARRARGALRRLFPARPADRLFGSAERRRSHHLRPVDRHEPAPWQRV